MSEYLRAEIDHRVGNFPLRVSCGLSAPWTILFGPSGAGKTSLLRVLAGLTRPDRGRVLLEGRALVETENGTWIKPAERDVGFVSQRPVLFPHMDVTANVAFGVTTLERRERGLRVAEMLALFEASHLAERAPRDLSGGEQQRVALARALAPEPRFLLLDEPFTGLDGGLKSIILERLTVWLAARKIPALYVSHDAGEALETGAEVLVMKDGEIQAQGPAALVLAAQRERLLRQLRGTAIASEGI